MSNCHLVKYFYNILQQLLSTWETFDYNRSQYRGGYLLMFRMHSEIDLSRPELTSDTWVTILARCWLLSVIKVNMDEKDKDKRMPDSRGAKKKQLHRNNSSNTYEKDMNKFLTIIYHNVNRLQEDKKPLRRTFSEPHQLKLCSGAPAEQSFMENSVPAAHRDVRRHSDFVLHTSQSEHSYSPKTFKRKVAFSDTLMEESNLSGWYGFGAKDDKSGTSHKYYNRNSTYHILHSSAINFPVTLFIPSDPPIKENLNPTSYTVSLSYV